ncbi:MAG: protein-tyrosine phosphatase family protein [Planctomycetales bacterium]|jgi:protein-tyrosine phosphatase
MREVHSACLWTGHAREARDARAIFDTGISVVVDLAYEEPPAQLPRQLVYCRFPIVDGAGNDPTLLRLALSTTVELLRAGTRTLVACSAGMSRSPTFAICALAVHLDQSPESVLATVNEKSSFELHGDLWTDVCEIVAELRSPGS